MEVVVYQGTCTTLEEKKYIGWQCSLYLELGRRRITEVQLGAASRVEPAQPTGLINRSESRGKALPNFNLTIPTQP